MATGAPIFNVKLPNDYGDYGDAYALPATEVREIKFEDEDADSEAEAKGKSAEIVVTNGEKYPYAQVLDGKEYPKYGFVFTVVDATATPGSPPLKVPANQLASITFTGPKEIPSWQRSGYIPDGKGNFIRDPDLEEEDEDTAIMTPGLLLFAGVGIAALIGAVAIFLAIKVPVDSILILLICKFADVPEIRYKQCFFCALYLALLPIVCCPLLFIPFFGTWAFFLCVSFAARAIVMGSLEVLEHTAWIVMTGFGISTWLLRRFAWEIAGSMF